MHSVTITHFAKDTANLIIYKRYISGSLLVDANDIMYQTDHNFGCRLWWLSCFKCPKNWTLMVNVITLGRFLPHHVSNTAVVCIFTNYYARSRGLILKKQQLMYHTRHWVDTSCVLCTSLVPVPAARGAQNWAIKGTQRNLLDRYNYCISLH